MMIRVAPTPTIALPKGIIVFNYRFSRNLSVLSLKFKVLKITALVSHQNREA